MQASLSFLMLLQAPAELSREELRVKERIQPVGGTVAWVSPDSSESDAPWMLSVDIENKGKAFDCTKIQSLKRLGALRILGGRTEGWSLSVLAQLPRLELLVVTGNGLADAELKRIGRCKVLTKLDIGGNQISAKGLAAISPVRTLFLYNTKISDADLVPLGTMVFLDQLVLPVSVTPGGMQLLARQLPEKSVSRL